MSISILRKKNKRTNLELVLLYKQTHDSTYVGELFQRYTHLITTIAHSYFNNEQDTEDAVMDVFEILLKDLKDHEIKNFSAWLYSVVKNHCLKKKNKLKYELVNNEDQGFDSIKFMESDTDTDLLIKKEAEIQLNNLDEALTKLTEEQKICIDLFYIKSKSYVEVSEITGYSIKQVKSYIQNGKRNLKKLI